MTHNIVAEFSCSIWKESEEERATSLGFSVGDFKQYQVVVGSVFNEEYNETLDSATILLSQIQKEDRLSYIKPYDFVRVYDKSTYDEETQTYTFDKVYLVDNFVEKENNIEEHIFGYTINLMSQTKLLEKIQCPNLAITHKLNWAGRVVKKTIWQHIKQYMELYVPKVKMAYNDFGIIKWRYEPVIKFPLNEISSSISKSFTSDDFVQVGAEIYQVSVSTVELPSNIDVSTVSIKRTMIVGLTELNVLEGPTATLNQNTRSFDIFLRTSNVRNGTVFVFYEYIDFTNDQFYEKFNVPCADMGFNAPTLRQLLTTLMLQVGCIPTVVNRTLSFLDFQLDAQDFGGGDYTINHTVNYIHRSLSSDSCVNSLVNISSNVLDSENEVVCETLGFRDRDNVLLKQQENLTLETRFPIYKVNKFVVNYFVDAYIRYPQLNISFDPREYRTNVNTSVSYIFNFFTLDSADHGFAVVDNDHIELAIECNYAQVIMRNIKFYPLIRNPDGSYSYCYDDDDVVVCKIMDLATLPYDPDHPTQRFIQSIYFDNCSYFTDAYMICEDVTLTYGRSDVSGTDSITFKCVNATFSVGGLNGEQRVIFMQQDITPLLVENSRRALLNTNFKAMTDEDIKTIDQLSQYLYGTVGYSIGSNKISGFSTTYEVGSETTLGWITKGYTYIENVMKLVTKISNVDGQNYASFLEMYQVPVVEDFNADLNGIIKNNIILKTNHETDDWYHPTYAINFAALFFDIYYQPLNSFNLAYVKKQESVDYLISQYDGNSSGLTDFDRLSLHEQEQVDRIGNEVLNISQRTTNYNQIQTFTNGPLSFMDDTNRSGTIGDNDNGVKYIIFKRTFSINNNCYNASYTGSKDAVLKDYFTSIRTKYRAYQYVDYNSSTLRKERDTLFVRIGEDWYDGDDKIWFGQWRFNALSNTQLTNTYQFVYNFNVSRNISKKITYVSEKGQNSKNIDETTKNDISVVTNHNTLAFIYEMPDNIGNGTYISNANYSSSYEFVNGLISGNDPEKYKIGGVPQSWQIWNEDSFNTSHGLLFLYDIDFYDNDFFYDINELVLQSYNDTKDVADTILKNTALSPIVKNDLVNTSTGTNIAFSLIDDNKSGNFTKSFYKDYAERINHTVEFIYYAETPNIKWSDYFIELSPFAAYKYNNNNVYNIIVLASNNDDRFEISGEPYSLVVGEGESVSLRLEDVVEIVQSSQYEPVSEILVNFNGYKYIKILYRDGSNWNDIVVFRRRRDDVQNMGFYITLNDTKSDYVMAEKNGILYRKYKVGKNTLNRTVVDIHD